MSGFTALNVEPEETLEEEIDDTKEIQLEEAFKLYQNALKLHSQGPDSFTEATEAYEELLKSEVFKYPEVVSEYAHDQLDDENAAIQIQAEPGVVSVIANNAGESSASSVPQLVYLSFKNRGQFILDVARSELKDKHSSRASLCRYYADSCRRSLKDFAEALERDDSDLDLWKKAARVADVLSIQRIARFCWESVLAGDDEGDQAIDLSGLDEAFAAGRLEDMIAALEDDLSSYQSGNARPKDVLLTALRKTNDPYLFLPQPPRCLEYLDDKHHPLSIKSNHKILYPDSRSMQSVGYSIVEAIDNVEDGIFSTNASITFSLSLPDGPEQVLDMQLEDQTIMSLTEHSVTEKNSEPADTEAKIVEEINDQDGITTTELDQVVRSPIEDTVITGSNTGELGEDGEANDEKDIGSLPVDETATTAATLPTRKRSSTAAGNEEPEGRTKSKRLRARESVVELTVHEDETTHDLPQYYQDQLAFLKATDQSMLASVDSFLSKLDIPTIGTLETISTAFWPTEVETEVQDTVDDNGEQIDKFLLRDLQTALMEWNDEKSQAMLSGHGNHDFVEKSTGLTLFLQHSKTSKPKDIEPAAMPNEEEVVAFSDMVNDGPMTIYDLSLTWLLSMLTSTSTVSSEASSPYMRELWSLTLKETVVQLIRALEEYLIVTLEQLYEFLTNDTTDLSKASRSPRNLCVPTANLVELTQTIFELHLDTYSGMIAPSSDIDENNRKYQRERLERWARLADTFMGIHIRQNDLVDIRDQLVVRFIWATTTFANQTDDDDKSHVMTCLQDLRDILEQNDIPALTLPNNAAMPQISIAAIDQEISRISTLDFFMSVFDSDNTDPVTVIEKLEPILEYDIEMTEKNSKNLEFKSGETKQVEKLVQFLQSGDATLKLYLWRRLQNAYTSISYSPKVVSCLLRAVQIIFAELSVARHVESEETLRRISMLKWLRDIDELILKVLVKIQAEANSFECMDASHLRASINVISSLARLLHGFALYDDSLRVGQTIAPQLKGASSIKQFEKAKDRFREMYVRVWTLQYTLLKEATQQHDELFPEPFEDLAQYLLRVHDAFGLRHYCKYSNKVFIKLVKTELSSLNMSQNYPAELARVFFDLYQLKLVPGLGDVDHGCSPDNLDKKTAIAIIPTVMDYACRYNIKDLIKSELKATIDKIQPLAGTVKGSPPMLYNKRVISAYLKSPVYPSELYKCIKGVGDLPTKIVSSETQNLANKKWYFLLGHISLAKYKSVKRVNPTPTTDLDTAAVFFRQDLEHNLEKWETWYRLAQVFEAKIEDDLIWNSAKLNDSRAEIATLERNSIHAYSMAIAIAMRSADDTQETAQKISSMFEEFGLRLYASSRPPLDMEAFKTDKAMRHLSSSVDATMSKEPFHKPIQPYALWKFAAHLLRRKFSEKPKSWISHYARSKCLWKMFQSSENNQARNPITVGVVIDAITDAIEALPKREKSTEYILEPHFRLVSVVHKLVHRRIVSHAQAVKYLQASSYAQKAHLSEDEQGPEWEPYILDILKRLGQADKSNWHHRIIARAAHVIYDGQPDIAGALGAKHEFTQQIFTKTMTLQVWKPEHERPGRHYVYTGRYVSFFVHLLDQLNDRASLDQLVRRIRRKPTDFLNHTKLWEEVVTTYARLLRRIAKVPEGREKGVFDAISHEDFTKQSEKLEVWALDPDTTSIVLDIMRDAIELKKLNNSLMKGTLIDDLIGDSYACLYEAFISQLPPEEQPAPPPPALPQGTFINMTTESIPGNDENRDRMRLDNLLTAQGDGTTAVEGTTVTISAPSGLGLQIPGSQPIDSPSVQPSVKAPASKPGRAKTITRREIQRRAEAAIVKPPPIKTPILSKRPVLGSTPNQPESGGYEAESAEDPKVGQLKDDEGPDSKASSRRGSIHDSADGEASDEESELTDLDDEKPKKLPLFPGLMRRAKADEGNVDDSVDGHDLDEKEEGDEANDHGNDEEDEQGIVDEHEVDNENENSAEDGNEYETAEENAIENEDDNDGMDVDGEVEIQDSQEVREENEAEEA